MCVILGTTKTIQRILVTGILLICLHFSKYKNVSAEETTYVLRKSCLLKPDPGPCRGNIVMYFYHPPHEKCRKFAWGGCQGNGNRFDTKEECRETCIGNSTSKSGKSRPRYCSLSFDYGYCFGAVPRYYYDSMWKVCKERLYSGCGGNKNNFYSFQQCESICRFGNGVIKDSRVKKGEVKKIIIINPDKLTTVAEKKNCTKTKKTNCSSAADGKDGKDGIDGKDGTR